MQRYPYLHASLSFGGWTLSGGFSQMANNSESLSTFVNNVVGALQETGFDGVDIDWEYPVVNGAPGESTSVTPQDAFGFPNLLTQLRTALDEQAEKNQKSGAGPTHYRISVAGAGGIDKIDAILQINPDAYNNIIKAIDVINLMTYDFHGAFDQGQPAPYNVSDFMSAMEIAPNDPTYNAPVIGKYDVVTPTEYYLELGFSPKQLAVGLPAYGRLVMIKEIGNTYGLYQTITGTPAGQYDNTGVFDYKCIQEQQCHGYNHLPTDMNFINPNVNSFGNYSHTPWGYSESTLTFLTYDDAESATYKTCWANKLNLWGYMIWDLTGDFVPSDPNSLVGAATGALLGQGC